MESVQYFITENYFFVTLVLFVLGACVGSFLNVCIYRLPEEGLSIVKPRSHCPQCKEYVRWYDNIPILSFILLKGKCRFCRKIISPQYLIVEALCGYLFVEYFILFGMSAHYVFYLVLTCLLLVSTWVDFKFQIIPDETNFFGMIFALLMSVIFPSLHNAESHLLGLGYSFLGLLVGGAMIYAIGVYGEFRFKKEAMGGGDVKLLAMVGAFLGWKLTILAFFLAPFLGAIVGLYAKYVKKEEVIPYGPFLSLGALGSLFAGEQIIARLFGDTDIPGTYIFLFVGLVACAALLEWGLHKGIEAFRDKADKNK